MSDAKARPYLPFYPDTWFGNRELQELPLAARGLAIQCLAEMHRGTPYGHIRRGAIIPDDKKLARRLNVKDAELRRLLPILLECGIFSRDEDGALYSPRLVRNEEVRAKRAAGGRQSINHPNTPAPKDGLEGYPLRSPSEDTEKGTPKPSQASGNGSTSPQVKPSPRRAGGYAGKKGGRTTGDSGDCVPFGDDAGTPIGSLGTNDLQRKLRWALQNAPDKWPEFIEAAQRELEKRKPAEKVSRLPPLQPAKPPAKPFSVPALVPK